jgi:hypothetical protein
MARHIYLFAVVSGRCKATSWILWLTVIATCCVNGAAQDQEAIQRTILKRQLRLIDATPASKPVVMRLDLELRQLTARAKQMPQAGRAQWLAMAMSPQGRLYQRFGMGDLRGFAKLMLGEAEYPHVSLHLDSYAGRDLTGEIRTTYRTVAESFGKPLAKAPIYKVAFGYQRQTNAAMEGQDRRTNRHIVILNRSALAEGDDWEAAVIHETWHTFQGFAGKSLMEQAIHEGKATYLTKLTNAKLADHKVMLWSEAKWEAAEANREAILIAFARAKDSSDPRRVNVFTKLNVKIPGLPAAPDRCGYYVGLLACRAWQTAHPTAKPADLISAKASDVYNALAATR